MDPNRHSHDTASLTILQVVPALGSGGAERTTVDVAQALVAAGHRALVVSSGGRLVAELPREAVHLEMRVDRKSPLAMRGNAKRLMKIVREEGVDILHARSRAPAWSAWLASRRTGAAFMATYHGAYSETNRAKAVYNSVMARGVRTIANSQWTADLVSARYPKLIARSPVIAIPRGTDFTRFDPARFDAEAIAAQRAKWGVGTDDIVVLHMARMSPWKGQTTVVEAVARLAPTHPRLRAVLAGDLVDRDTVVQPLRARIAEARLGERIVLPGLADPASALAACDVCVVASTEAEAFGRTAVEAGAMGKIVIATDIGAVGETIVTQPDGERTGWTIPPGDPVALANALETVLALTPRERAAIGDRARARGERLFSLAQMCAATLAVYTDIMAERAG